MLAFLGEHCIQQEGKPACVQTDIITASMMAFLTTHGSCGRRCLLTWQLEVPKSLICLMSYAFVAIDY